MAKKDQSDREIEELLGQLKEKTAADAAESREPVSKKSKSMTDDDVKALLRKYYTDVDEIAGDKEPSFVIDTSDFEPDAEPEREQESVSEPEPVKNDEVEAEAEQNEEIAPEPEALPEKSEPEAEAEPERNDEPETESEAESERNDEPENYDEGIEEENTEEDAGLSVEEIIADDDLRALSAEDIADVTSDEDEESGSFFSLEEDVTPPDFVTDAEPEESEVSDDIDEDIEEPTDDEDEIEEPARKYEEAGIIYGDLDDNEPDNDEENEEEEGSSFFSLEEDVEPPLVTAEPETEIPEADEPEDEDGGDEYDVIEERDDRDDGEAELPFEDMVPEHLEYERSEDTRPVAEVDEEIPETEGSVAPVGSAERVVTEADEPDRVIVPNETGPMPITPDDPEDDTTISVVFNGDKIEIIGEDKPCETSSVELTASVHEHEEIDETPIAEELPENDTEDVEEETAPEPEPEIEPEPEEETETEPEPEIEPEPEQEWRPANDVSGRSDNNELDLLVALGLGDRVRDKYGDERLRRAEERMVLSDDIDAGGSVTDAYAYRGRELTPHTDPAKVKAAYAEDRRKLLIRLMGTLALTFVLFIYDNSGLFGLDLSGLIGSERIYILISSVLLIGCAAFSAKRLADSLMFTFGRRKYGNAVTLFTVVGIILYDVAAIIVAEEGSILFDFTAALGLTFEALADLFDCQRERDTYNVMTSADRSLYGLCPLGTDEYSRRQLSAEKISFAEGYFRHSGNRRSYPLILFVIVLPLLASGAIICVIAAAVGFGFARSVGAFPAVFAFAAPLTWTFCAAWQRLGVTNSLTVKKAGVIGAYPGDDYIDSGSVLFDDEVAFPKGSAVIRSIRFFDNHDIYESIYRINALFRAAGGPLYDVMKDSAAKLGEARSVTLTGAADHYVEALVDGKLRVCAGSYNALTVRGIKIARDPDDARDGEICSVMYAAVDGSVCARICVEYKADGEFAEAVRLLSRDGVAVCIRTLDPNLDRAMLVAEFGEGADVTVRREPKLSDPERSAPTAIFSAKNVAGLAAPLVSARKLCRLEHSLNIARVAQMAVGVVFAALLIFAGTPAVGIAAGAAMMQLVGVLPPMIIYLLGTKI